MTSKRSRSFVNASAESHRSLKRPCFDSSDRNADESNESQLDFEVPSDTKAAILFLKSIVPLNKFEGKIPAIVLKHQLYCVVKDKTLVDRQLCKVEIDSTHICGNCLSVLKKQRGLLTNIHEVKSNIEKIVHAKKSPTMLLPFKNNLWEKNQIRLFKFTSGSDEFGVVLTDDYVSHIKAVVSDPNVLLTIDKFVSDVLPNHIDVSISKKDASIKFQLNEEEITHLVNTGVLTTRDIGSWWLSIPGAGVFMKNFSNGRKALIRMIRQRKFREILERDLLSRNFDSHSKLGITYHTYDIIGAEIVKSVETTSGRLLRLDIQSDSRARSKR